MTRLEQDRAAALEASRVSQAEAKWENAAHTEGPWAIGMRGGANSNLVYTYDGATPHQDTPICSVFGLYMHCDINEQKDCEGMANARLIAAAPEMLEALRDIYNDLKQGAIPNHNDEWWDRARSAIARATGEQP